MPAIISKVPGKIILFGEHAVVYDFPAIAIPIDAVQLKVSILPAFMEEQSTIRIRNFNRNEDIPFSELELSDPIRISIENVCTFINLKPPHFKMTITSSIPIAAGLGSSAALAVAITKCMSQFLGINLKIEEINSLAFKSEEIQHGLPSGIDNSVITFSKPIFFSKTKTISPIKIKSPIHIILADTGKRTLTKEVVAFVKQRLESDPDTIKPILSDIGRIVEKAVKALCNGEIEKLGTLMIRNHNALKQLGVSSIELNRLVKSALKNGALGAKLCGGGRGGYMVAICMPSSCEKVSSGLISVGATHVIPTMIKESK